MSHSSPRFSLLEEGFRSCGEGWVVLALAPIACVAGMLVRPESLLDNRIGYSMVDSLSVNGSIGRIGNLSFYELPYALLNIVFPGDVGNIEIWDGLVAILGGLVLLVAMLRIVGRRQLGFLSSLFLLASTALSGMYVFMLNKDFVQLIIFCIVALVISSEMRLRGKALLSLAVFLVEFVVWRRYFAIVACFALAILLALKVLGLGRRRSVWWYAGFVAALLVLMMAFAYALKFVSSPNYGTIVSEHSVTRDMMIKEKYNTGIVSVIPLTTASSPFLFVLNWGINTLRLLFPLELFRFGSSQWLAAIYQLCVTGLLIRAIHTVRGEDSTLLVAIATYCAFVIASGTFEPDYGSWMRHEMAALPIVLIIFSRALKECGRGAISKSGEGRAFPASFGHVPNLLGFVPSVWPSRKKGVIQSPDASKLLADKGKFQAGRF